MYCNNMIIIISYYVIIVVATLSTFDVHALQSSRLQKNCFYFLRIDAFCGRNVKRKKDGAPSLWSRLLFRGAEETHNSQTCPPSFLFEYDSSGCCWTMMFTQYTHIFWTPTYVLFASEHSCVLYIIVYCVSCKPVWGMRYAVCIMLCESESESDEQTNCECTIVYTFSYELPQDKFFSI